MKKEERRQLDRIFNPRGFALFGGINHPGSFGYLIVLSQIRYGYSGKLYPISSKGGEIAGQRVYKSLAEVDGPVDLASISVPAKAVPDVLQDCLKHGVAGAQIHSSGFAEVGDQEGVALQEEIFRIAQKGLRIVGPNCFGIHCPRGGITLLPGAGFSKDPGSVALISQSGGVATDFGYEAQAAGLGASKIISFGNGCDLDAIQLMDYLSDDTDTESVAAYIEGVKDGARFIEIIRRTANSKAVVVWKAGLTAAGGQAARGHTGSLAGDEKIWTGALTQAGAVFVQGLDEIMDALTAITYLKRPGPHIALIGGGGAIGVFSCDVAHRWGLSLPRFSSETQNHLRMLFPTPGNSMANPLDTGSPIIAVEIIKNSIERILACEPVDVLIVVLLLRSLEVEMPAFMDMLGTAPQPPGSYLAQVLEVLTDLKHKTGKDIAVVFDNRAKQVEDVHVENVAREWRSTYQAHGIAVFPSAARALRAVRHAITAQKSRRRLHLSR